jgi:hypothetical protein
MQKMEFTEAETGLILESEKQQLAFYFTTHLTGDTR